MKVDLSTVILTLVAMYGAILSTYNAVIAYWRGKISVIVSAGIRILIPDPTKQDYFYMSITNSGTRPVTIVNAGGVGNRKKKNNYLLTPAGTNLPVVLKDGETHPILIVINQGFDMLEEKVESLGAYDSLGTFHPIPKKELQELFKKYDELKSRGKIVPEEII